MGSGNPGEEILVRHVHEHVRYALPMTVVADEGERVIAFLADQTPGKWTSVDFAGQADGPAAAAPRDFTWGRTQVLHIFEIEA